MLLVFGLLVFVDRVVDRTNLGRLPAFRKLLISSDGFYSLTNLQFLSWTVVFLFSLAWVYLVRIQGGVLGYIPQLPAATLALMGINTASALGSKAIAIGKPDIDEQNLTPEEKNSLKEWRGRFWGMLYEDWTPREENHPDLTRVQFFLWTVASIIIYLVVLIGLMLGPYYWGFAATPLTSLTIPDVDPSLVTLMGLSQGAYVGVKYVQADAAKKRSRSGNGVSKTGVGASG